MFATSAKVAALVLASFGRQRAGNKLTSFGESQWRCDDLKTGMFQHSIIVAPAR